MTSDPKQMQSQSAQNGRGYTPAPLQKTRTITGSNLPKVSDQPLEDDLNTLEKRSTDQQVDLDRSSKPSIQINLNTIDQTTQNVIEQEQEANNKLAEFSPLSSTPLVSPPQASDFVSVGDWEHSQNIPETLIPPPQSYSAHVPDIYKGRRRSLWLLMFIFAMFAWFVGMAIQVGVTRLVNDPYGETMKLVTGDAADSKALEELRVPGVQTTVVVQEGAAIASVLSVHPLQKNVFLVQGVVLNESSKTISSALLKLTLREPQEASTSWVQRFEFGCCEYLDQAQVNEVQVAERLERLKSGSSMNQSQIRLSEGGDLKFSFIAPITGKGIKLKKNMLPRASVEVVFFE